LPFFGFSEPIEAKKNKYGTTEWTLWDRFEFADDPTLKEIITWFQKEHKLDISMVSQGVSMLWSSFVGKKKVRGLPLFCSDMEGGRRWKADSLRGLLLTRCHVWLCRVKSDSR
jgi:Ubiquitin fold domain